MKCSNCGKDGMVQSRAGWLCLSCGHLERDKTKPAGASVAKITTGKDSHDQLKGAAAAPKDEPKADIEPKPSPTSPAAPKPVWSDEKVPEPAKDEPTNDEPKLAPPAVAPPWASAAPGEPTADKPADQMPEKEKSESDQKPENPKPEKPKPSPENLVAESAPGVAAASTLPLNGKPPLKPVTHPRPVNPGLIVRVAIGLLVLVLTAGAGYLYLVQPKMALAAYLRRVGSAKTTAFAATTTGTGAGYRFALQLHAKTDTTDTAKPKLSLEAAGALGATSDTKSGGNFAANLVLTDQTLYIKAKNAPSQFLTATQSDGEWHKSDPAKLGALQCLASGKGLASVLSNAASAQVPVKTASFAGLGTINGAQMLHYRGEFDPAKLSAYLDAATKDLAPECRLPAVTRAATYELWQGWSGDRLKLKLTDAAGTDLEVTLDSGSYGQAAGIQAPAGPQDAAATPAPSPSSTPAATPAASPDASASAASRDAQRKLDLAAFVAAYRTTAQGGYYQTTPPAVSVSAKDPSTGQAYQVSRGKVTALGQIEYRAGGRCTAADITPGAASTHYVALHMKLEGQADYCLDVK